MKTMKELLTLQWNDLKMVEYCLKSTYIDMGNYYLDMGDKPTISRDIYYSDQKAGSFEMADDPGTSWNVFKNYNIRLNSPLSLIDQVKSDGFKVFITTHYNNDKTNGMIKGFIVRRWSERVDNGREATPEERRVILKALEQSLADYEKRLESYYKRYSNKIRTVSYWADR